MRSPIKRVLTAAAVLVVATFALATFAQADVISPASNNPVPGHAHTNIHIYVPDNGAKVPPPPSFYAPQAPAKTAPATPPAVRATTPSSNTPFQGHCNTTPRTHCAAPR